MLITILVMLLTLHAEPYSMVVGIQRACEQNMCVCGVYVCECNLYLQEILW